MKVVNSCRILFCHFVKIKEWNFLFFVLFLSFPLEKQVIGEQIRLMNLFFTLSKDDEHQVLNFFVNYSIFCRFMKKNFYVQNFYNYHFFFRFY